MTDPIETSEEYSGDDLDRIGAKWLAAIQQSEKREKDWSDAATKAEKAYLCDDTDGSLPAFNILHSNIETITPSLFNSSPAPDIRPRFASEDEALKNVAEIYDRAIRVQIDDGRLETEMECEVQDSELAGRGVLRVKFDSDEDEMGNPVNERLVFENVSWRDYREGPAKRWRDVPWVAYRHEVSEHERQKLENPELMDKQKEFKPDTDDKDSTIWEVWCKKSKKVYFVIAVSGHVLNIVDDPLGLKGFFPQPAPVQPITATGKRTPVCPYSSYSVLADELDRITKRINAIMKGLKVRGLFAGNAQALEDLKNLGDNEFAPAADVESLLAIGGLDKAVLWWPIETSVMVLRELYLQREQVKQTIYEVTGISDIVRGASKSGETARAQQIKAEWGSLRIKRKQRMIERSVRDVFVIAAEIIATLFSPMTLQRMTGIQIGEQEAAILSRPLDHFTIDIESDSTIRADLTKSRSEMAEFLQGTAQFFNTIAPIVASEPQAAGPMARVYQAFAAQYNLGKSAEDALDKFVALAEQAAEQPQDQGAQQAMQAEMQARMAEIQIKAKEIEVKQMEAQMKNQADTQSKAAELAQKDRSDQLKAEIEAAKMELEREKLGLEKMRINFDAQRATEETELKRTEMGVSQIDGVKENLAGAMAQAMAAVLQEVQASNQQIMAGQQAIVQAVNARDQQILAAITAEEQLDIVKDENGRPVGARKRKMMVN